MTVEVLAQRRAQAAIGHSKTGDARGPTASCSASSRPQKKCSKKRRASRRKPKAPVRQLFAQDTAQFKEIVQRFTCLPPSAPQLPPSPPQAPPPSPPPPRPTSSSAPVDNPFLASSAIACSLRATLHTVSACLKLLHSSAPHSKVMGALSEELDLGSRKTVAFLQGLLHPHPVSREHASVSFELASLLASTNHFGNVESNSSSGNDPSGPIFNSPAYCGGNGSNPVLVNPDEGSHNNDSKLSIGHGGGAHDQENLFAMQTASLPNDSGHSSSNRILFAMKTRDILNETHDKPSKLNYGIGSDSCNNMPRPISRREIHTDMPKLASECTMMSSSNDPSDIAIVFASNDQTSIISSDGVEDSSSYLDESPQHDIFHIHQLNSCHKSTLGEELLSVEHMDSEVEQEGKLLDKIQLEAKELERFLLEEHNNLDFYMDPFFRQMVSQQILLPPI